MIGKLEEDKKACWSEHLLELLLAYNATRSTVTRYSPYYLLFGRRSRIPVDYLFPTLHDLPHQTKIEVSAAAMQKRLKEAFALARHLTSEEAAKQCRYYDHKTGAVALQPWNIVMVCTNGFVGKRSPSHPPSKKAATSDRSREGFEGLGKGWHCSSWVEDFPGV